MKEHEHPYWMAVHAEGSPHGRAHKEIKEIAAKHGGKFEAYEHLVPENVTQAHYSYGNKSGHRKAVNAVRKAGHMVEGKDY